MGCKGDPESSGLNGAPGSPGLSGQHGQKAERGSLSVLHPDETIQALSNGQILLLAKRLTS